MTLQTVTAHDGTSAWYRTQDGRFDILGDDLNCTGAAARAAGAGPVWSWRPAKATRDWTPDQHVFTTKAACLADLARHLGTTPPPPSSRKLTIRRIVGQDQPNGVALFPWRWMYDVEDGGRCLARVVVGLPGEALKLDIVAGALAPAERAAVERALGARR
jgi:hypothetical protein